jgi:hypothetical protein
METIEVDSTVKAFANMLASKLEAERRKGETIPSRPKTAKVLCDEYQAKFNEKIPDTMIREAVNYLRSLGKPVANNGTGYFWAINDIELRHTKEQIDHRMMMMQRGRRGLDKCFTPEDTQLVL